MGYLLTEDEEMIRKVVAEFARDVVDLEAAHDRDRHDRFPTEVLEAASQLGLTAMALPAEEGGAGVTPVAYALAIQELAAVEPSLAALLATHNGMVQRILRHGHDELKAEVLPKLAAGEFGAYLATEEAGGLDKTQLTTTATSDGDKLVLQGAKTWGLGAAGAKHFVILVNLDEAGPTWVYVPADAEGLSLGRNEPLMGLRAAGIRTVYLDDVTVPSSHLLGEPGSGLEHYQNALPWLQVGVAAAIAGAIEGSHRAARDFAETRTQFGQPIGHFQAVSDHITDMELQKRALQALTLEAASHLETGGHQHAAIAKAFSSEIAAPTTRKAIRVQGGTGFMREGGTERFARDVRCLYFVGEPPAIARDRIKRSLLDLEFGVAP